MTDATSRDEIRVAFGRTICDRSLVYMMGPYKSFNLNYVLSEEELAAIDIDDLPGPIQKLFTTRDEVDDAFALPRRVQGTLRADPKVNALLTVDVDLGTDEVDAAMQLLTFAVASNATVLVLSFLGYNFGVNEEAESVFERLSETHGGRIVFAHEATVTNEMIRAVRACWDFRVETYDTETELHKRAQLFVTDVMNRGLHGDLDQLDRR